MKREKNKIINKNKKALLTTLVLVKRKNIGSNHFTTKSKVGMFLKRTMAFHLHLLERIRIPVMGHQKIIRVRTCKTILLVVQINLKI